MSTPFDLSLFCANEDDPREPLRQPFSFDTHSAASNGAIAIMIPRDHSIPPLQKYRLNTLIEILRDAIKKRGTEAETGSIRLAQLELDTAPCNECEGDGVTHVCTKCAGSGRQPWTEKLNADCMLCEGSGTITLREMELSRRLHGHDAGYQKKPARCKTCYGIGKQPTKTSYAVGSATFNPCYLYLIRETLPNATIYAFGKHDPALIVFTGGLGIIMPTRQSNYQ